MSTTSDRPVALVPVFDSIPAELRETPAWVMWRYELDSKGKWTKPPLTRGGGRASTTNPDTWATFDAVRERYDRGGFDGVGFVLTNGIAGVDLDKCITVAGVIEPWASEALDRFTGTYRERSPSGRGYRIFTHGTPGRCGKGGPGNRLEVYAKDSPRYLTVTGHALDDVRDIVDGQDALDWLHATHMAGSAHGKGAPADDARQGATLSDDAVIAHARKARNGGKFADLWAGGHAGHASASEADAALVGILAFYTQDPVQLDRLFRRSGLMREKWDTRRGETTYGAMTIANILTKPGQHFGDRTEGRRSRANGAEGVDTHADAQDAPEADSAAAKGKRRASQEAGADTEDAIASLLVRDYRDTFRYAAGLGWMRWRGDHWEQDDRLAHFDVARRLSRARGVQATDADNRRLGSAKFVNGVVTLARSDPRIVHGADEFDSDPYTLNTPAGIVDLTTGTLRAHDHALVTKVTAVAPDFQASRAIWHSFLRDVFNDDIELVDFTRRLLGYVLTGATHEQILAFCFGTGANGKSTLLDLMLWLMGTYAGKLPADALMARRGERHPTEIAGLKGIRLAVSNEIDEGEFWAESKLKELTGDQVLTARFMRMDYFTFNATHKHVIAGNHRPQIRAMDEAMRRRIVLVPFNVRFEGSKRDKGLPAKLRASGPAVLADLIEGAAEWHRHGLGIPAVVRQASDEYATTMDSLGNWMAECCITNPDIDCKARLLYTSYSLWKKDRGEVPVSETRWGEQMMSRGYAKVRNNGMRYKGLDLTGEAHDRAIRGGQ